MPNTHVFISHSSKDDAFVKQLREALEGLGISVWVDSRNLRGGSKLAPEIEEAIEQAHKFVVVLSKETVESPWVKREIRKALEVEQKRKAEGYRVIPLLVGVGPNALGTWFDEEPVGVKIEVTAGGVGDALPALLAAIGERLPDDPQTTQEVLARPVAELKLRLRSVALTQVAEGVQRATATAQLIYDPADPLRPAVESREFKFTAPLGPIEAEDLRWYLESYYLWPTGVFNERAADIESRLPLWGQDLYKAATGAQSAQKLLADWMSAAVESERRFSVMVENRALEGSEDDEQAAADEAASALLSLPWELLHDGDAYLFHDRNPVRVRRSLPKERPAPAAPTGLPIRILLVSPRPEDKRAAYIDHRASAKPLVEALEDLGELVSVSLLSPPTFPALQEALRDASKAGEPFHVVHFDGHGVYDRERSLGALCFEDPADTHKLTGRASELIYAAPPKGKPAAGHKYMVDLVRAYRVPLMFLEACQSAASEEVPTASVAVTLLEEGVTSVVAMSHSILVETAQRFVRAFYQELAEGKRIGTAMLAGQQALYSETYRGKMLGAGDLHLQDWFVPVLYQEEHDPQLVTRLPPKDVRELQEKRRALSLGELPAPPAHDFIGRSRELLALERLLADEPYAVIRGQGGEGKTTLAAELARWSVRVGRFRRAAFVSLEHYTDARGALDSLGRQLVPGYSVANYSELKDALQPVERALRDRPTIIVLDNMESVLPDRDGRAPAGSAPVEELFDLCQSLLAASPDTRLVFTTREPLPAPFNDERRERPLGALDDRDAIRLVGEVMKREGLTPKADDPGADPREVTELVEAVGRHARALTLLAREVARQGVSATTENVRRLMEGLHANFPGDRENSLYASVELSLRRLPAESREQAKALAVFQGGAQLAVLAHVLGAEPEAVGKLAGQLIEVGLAEYAGDNHLRLDPALPSYLLREISEDEWESARARWAEAMAGLTRFLYDQLINDIGVSARLTMLELPNLLAMLHRAEGEEGPEETVDLADCVERLLSHLGRPRALAEATGVRERAAQKLGEWGHARAVALGAEFERLFERGEVEAARMVAVRLLKQCLEAGEGAYDGAAYDLAGAYAMLGRVMRMEGAAAEALPLLGEARRRFEALAEAGSAAAASMVAATLSECGDCLVELGRLDEAAEAYEEAIRRGEGLGNQRGVAVSRAQLGDVRLRQRRYDEAWRAFEEARRTFEELGEPVSLATVLHHIGTAYRHAELYEKAENAYRQSLAIFVQQRDSAREADVLNDLGILYDRIGRLEEAVKCYRQAADIFIGLQNQRREGMARNNLGNTLIRLGRYDEARPEMLRAIECDKPYGHVAEPWKTWQVLRDLEQAVGNAGAAARARRKALESYLAYRMDGGYGATPGAQLCAMVGEAIARRDTAEIERQLTELLLDGRVMSQVRALIPKMLAVLRGARDPALADDAEVDYRDAAELRLLLGELAG